MKEKNQNIRYDIVIPVGLFLALLLFKVIFVVTNRSLPLIADEFTYAKYARKLIENGTYKGVQYPLLYPLLLSPAYLFGENFYLVMKLINAFFSAMVPIVVYFICRLYMDEKKSGVCALFSAVIPFQYMTTMALMSENVYFPMFLLAVYVVLKDFKHEVLGDILLGILLGALFLTRHITLTLIPVFLFGWLLKQLEKKHKIGTILWRGMLICVVLLITYSPWIIMCKSYGYSMKLIVGFSIASKTNPEQLTMGRLAMTAGFYACYYILICAPFLPFVIKSIRALDTKKLFCSYNRLWVMGYGILAALFVAVVRHSWRAAYNYPEFTKIKGRYVIYVPVLVLMVGMAAIYSQKVKFKHTWSNILLNYIVPAAGLILAYLVDIQGTFYKLQNIFIDFYECTDGRRIKMIGIAFVVVTMIVLLVYQWIQDYGSKQIKKYGFAVMAVCIIGLELWGAPQYYAQAKKGDANNCKNNYRYAWELKDALDTLSEEEGVVYIGELPEGVSTYVKRAMEFYGYSNYSLKTKVDLQEEKACYTISPEGGAYENQVIETITEFQWEEETYYLQKIAL